MRTVVVGAGIAGLGAGLTAARERHELHVLERAGRPGGLARTDVVDGFAFEQTGHFLHFRDRAIEGFFRRGRVPLDRIERRAAILVGGKAVPYPLQYNLWALEERPVVEAAIADLKRASESSVASPSNFDELLRSSWGETLVSLFFRPYNEKLWGRPLEELPPDCAGSYLPRVDVDLAVVGATQAVAYGGYHETFDYPASGRLADLFDGLAARLGGRITYGDGLAAVDVERGAVHTERGRRLAYDRLVSTAPLGEFLALAGVETDETFDATTVVNVRIGVRGTMTAPYHWVYVVDPAVPFHRIGFPRNVNARTCPGGCASLSVEYTPPREGPGIDTNDLAARALAYATEHGLIAVDDCLTVSEVVISPAYVVDRAPGRARLADVTGMLAEDGVRLAGRFGLWDYLSMEESFVSGAEAARNGWHRLALA